MKKTTAEGWRAFAPRLGEFNLPRLLSNEVQHPSTGGKLNQDV